MIRMRTLLVCLLLLVGGAIINIAVAWGLTIFYHAEERQRELSQAEIASLWTDYAPDAWPDAAIRGTRHFYGGEVLDELVVNSENRCWLMLVIQSGWPLRSFRGARIEQFSREHSLPWTAVESRQPGLIDWEESLPFHPMWRGVTVNTIAFAAILWLLCITPCRIRRWMHIRRGLCPKCAYPVGTSDTCTECGRPIKRKAETQKAETQKVETV